MWHLRHWLQYRQLRTWIHDNHCYLTIYCDTGQHSQFLRCLVNLAIMVNLVNLAIPAILVKTFAFVNDMMFKILHRIDCKILKNCCRFIVCFHVSVSIATLWKYFTTMHARERVFSAPWKSLCYISWLLRLNNFPQLSHSNLLTSAWISLMCFFRTLFPQTGFCNRNRNMASRQCEISCDLLYFDEF